MRAGWQAKNIGEVCDVIAGQSPKGSSYNSVGVGLPFYQGKKDFGARQLLPPTTWTTEITKKAMPGDILMSVRAPVGPINEATHEICIGRGLAAIRAGGDLDRNYLWYSLLWLQPRIKGSAGAVFDSINKTSIERLPLPLPPLEEQRRIVAILDEAFEGLDRARANAEANLSSAREVFSNLLITVFSGIDTTARRLTLSSAASTFGRGRSRHRPRNAPFLYDGPYPFVQTGDIRNSNGTVVRYSQTYSEEGLAQSKLWPAGTVCITIAANIAETAVLGFDACFPDSIIGMVANPDITSSDYVELMLRFFSRSLKEKGKGSAQDNINLGTFEEATFPFPPLPQQRRAVEVLTNVSNETASLVDNYQKATGDCELIRQSLLNKAFAGELT